MDNLTPKSPKVSKDLVSFALVVIVGAAFYEVLKSPAKPAPPPPAPTGLILRPTFSTTTAGEVSAGTAFVARVPGFAQPVLLSALHLLGPAGGLPRDVPSVQVPEVVEGVFLHDAFSGAEVGRVTSAVVIPSASIADGSRGAGDVLAFWAADLPASSRVLASQDPRVGESVWLAAQLADGQGGALHRAVVEEAAEGWLVYRFDDPNLSLSATSGAPILNSRNQVVAINIGGGTHLDALYGTGNSVGNFIEPLARAMRAATR